LAEAYVADHRHLAPLLKNVRAARTSTRKEILRGLDRARAIIHDQLAEPLDVPMMAKEAGMSVFHFFRAFKTVHGITPHQYRIELRLQKAAELLVRKGLSATEVAAQCGFADKSAFSKAFKKHFGMPPSAAKPGSSRF
jgi:AraC-like DNA-binding protein